MVPNTAKLTVTSKGQVTLRRSVLEHLGARPGDVLEVDLLPGGRAEVRAAPKGDLTAFFNSFPNYKGPSLTIEDMNEIIGAGWAGELSEDNS